MPEVPELNLEEHRLGLLKAKLGGLLNWRPPAIFETIGPYDPTIFTRFDQKRKTAVDLCTAQLRNYSDAEIQVISDRNVDDPRGLRDQWRKFQSSELDRLPVDLPWHAGGFGHPDHVADFEYWCKMPRFTIEEVLCLSIGIDPKEFDARRVEQIKTAFRTKKSWPSLQFIIDRHEQLVRTFFESYTERPIRPLAFLDWAEKVDFETHPEFLRLLKRYNAIEKRDQHQGPNQRRADEREIDSVALLITAIAIDQFGYRPGAPRSPIPKEIAEIVAKLGMRITDETVRKYLKRGARFLPEGWESE